MSASRAVWAWDIEAENWDQVKCVVARSNMGDREAFYGSDSLERMAEVMKKAGGNWIAHAGGIYDTLLLSNVWPRPWPEIIMAGSAVLIARDGTLRVRDSFRWWLAGLGAVGKYLDSEDDRRELRGEQRTRQKGGWLKGNVDRQRIGSLTSDELLAYCEQDVEILLEGIGACTRYLESQNARVAWTAGGCALNMLQALEPFSWKMLGRMALDFDSVQSARECVRGARVESWVLGKVSPVYCYDLKSAYPASYADTALGLGVRRAHAGDRYNAVWLCRWRWPWRDKIPPVTDQATNAGAGWCRAWCIHEEIQALEAEGVKVERLEGWAPELVAPIGQVYARELFSQKEGGAFFAKVFLNSLHGKFSERPIREKWTSLDKPSDFYGSPPKLVGPYWTCWQQNIDKAGKCPRHLQPIAAAQILGRCRMRLWEKAIKPVRDAGWRIFYTDTDSLHTDCPPDKMPVALGGSLGELAFEGGPYEGIYLGPKAYALLDPTTGESVKGALKGVPWKNLNDAVIVERDKNGFGVPALRFKQARGLELGRDHRRDVFEAALTRESGVQIVKEGIASFSQGARGKGWHASELPRTIKPRHRGKVFRREVGADTWSYQTPAERILEMRDEALDLDPHAEYADESDDGFLDLFDKKAEQT